MTKREFADKDLRCASCGDGFVLSAGEQELFRLRGIAAELDHCPSCVRSHSRTASYVTSADRSTA